MGDNRFKCTLVEDGLFNCENETLLVTAGTEVDVVDGWNGTNGAIIVQVALQSEGKEFKAELPWDSLHPPVNVAMEGYAAN